MESVRWDAPGPGVWEAEGAHFARPVPRFGRAELVVGFANGFRASTSRYGLMLSHFQPAIVNDFFFMKAVGFGAPPNAKGPPPKAILWLLTRLVPKIRARIAICRDAFANKVWRDDLRQWDEIDKPAALRRHAELLAGDLTLLGDEALAAHVKACVAHLGDMITLHHRYTITCMLPVGDLLAHVSEWTGEAPGAVLRMLRGSTPISRGILASELGALASAIRAEENAKAVLGGREAAAVVAALSQRPGAVGETARAFFEGIRYRALSYDIASALAGEMPELLVGALRAAVAGEGQARQDDAAERIAAIRAKVAAEHQAEFDALLAEARAINRLRDERGIYSDGFAVGIGRRAALELGRRLTERGLLRDAGEAVDLDADEGLAMLAGKAGPSPEEMTKRITWRRTKTVADIPAFLGGKPGAPPDPSSLPAAARRAARAIDAAVSNLFKESDAKSTEVVVRGLAVNDGVYEGIARVVADASEFVRLEQGDVLVTRATAPYFNVVLPLLGAIVTDRGGQLCHAAIVAREYGIPGIVGTKDATVRIPDGARVRVDGLSGEVTILSRPPILN